MRKLFLLVAAVCLIALWPALAQAGGRGHGGHNHHGHCGGGWGSSWGFGGGGFYYQSGPGYYRGYDPYWAPVYEDYYWSDASCPYHGYIHRGHCRYYHDRGGVIILFGGSGW